MFAFLIILPIAAADNENVLLSLKDVTDNSDVSNVIVTYTLNEDSFSKFVEPNQIMRMSLSDGQYRLSFLIDDFSTKGKDFYANQELEIDSNLITSIYVYPIGSIRGVVKDSLDNVVNKANLKFDCSGNPKIPYPETTDMFGSFHAEIPVGNCNVFATYEEGVGSVSLDIAKGSLQDIEINLDKSLIPAKQSFPNAFLMILFLVLIILTILIFKNKSKLTSKKDKEVQDISDEKNKLEKLNLGKRAKDILETLKDKEKQIIDYIQSQGGKTTQAKIYIETGIPKASLFRYMQSLQQKNIIEINKIGNMKKVKLTGWFLDDKEVEP